MMAVALYAFVLLVLNKPSNLLTSSTWYTVEHGKVKTKGELITDVPSIRLSKQPQLPPKSFLYCAELCNMEQSLGGVV